MRGVTICVLRWGGGGVDAPVEWFTNLVAVKREDSDTVWDLHLLSVSQLSDGCPVEQVVSRDEFRRWHQQPPAIPYGGCQSIIIRRPHFERLTALAQRTLLGRVRDGYQMITAPRRQPARAAARQLAQTQLAALTALHAEIPTVEERRWTTPKQLWSDR
jgi:hypothetical protein